MKDRDTASTTTNLARKHTTVHYPAPGEKQKTRIGITFLVDTGSVRSIIPLKSIPLDNLHLQPPTCTLSTATGQNINITGELTNFPVDFGFQGHQNLTFIIANIQQPILGMDFLSKYRIKIYPATGFLKQAGSKTKIRALSIPTANHTSYEVYNVPPGPFQALITEYQSNMTTNRGHYKKSAIRHRIETQGGPIAFRARPIAPDRLKAVKKEFENLLDQGIISRSKSNWSSPLHVVTKPDKSLRITPDFRALNNLTILDRFAVPNLRGFRGHLHGKTIFSCLDLEKAFYNIPIHEDDRHKTATIYPEGLIEWNYLAMGLKNSAQAFSRFLQEVMHGIDFAFCYIDDILIASDTLQDHKNHLREVLNRLAEYGLKLNLQKSTFGQTEVKFLGHTINKHGVRPPTEKINSFLQYPEPQTINALRRFLGAINFYHQMIPHLANKCRRFNALLTTAKKNDKTPIIWSEELRQDFTAIKSALAKAVSLVHPDPNAQLRIVTDASDTAMGATLEQMVTGVWKPRAFFSKTFTTAQTKYSTYTRELRAIYEACRHWFEDIDGRDFHIITDHKPLVSAMKSKTAYLNKKEFRWILFISQLTTDIRYIPGEMNVVADALSRTMCAGITDQTSPMLETLQAAQNSEPPTGKILQKLSLTSLPNTNITLWCDNSTNPPRPYVPPSLRETILAQIHNLGHPGAKATALKIQQRFFWPNMNTEAAKWARCCINCQQAKVGRHTKPPVMPFPRAEKFAHIHIDLCGELPTAPGNFKYLLTIIDRATNWVEAFPLTNIQADTICKKLYNEWIARYGCPRIITSDQGTQFMSALFQQLLSKLGVHGISTLPYCPQTNGKVERVHRTLKASLKAAGGTWTEKLPHALISMRTSITSATGSSPFESTFDRLARLPGDIFDFPAAPTKKSGSPYVHHDTRRACYIPKNLLSCDYVFMKVLLHKGSLTPPYTGPHKVIKRRTSSLIIDVNGVHKEVALCHLKPAHILQKGVSTETSDDAERRPASAGSDSQQPTKHVTFSENISIIPHHIATPTTSVQEWGHSHPNSPAIKGEHITAQDNTSQHGSNAFKHALYSDATRGTRFPGQPGCSDSTRDRPVPRIRRRGDTVRRGILPGQRPGPKEAACANGEEAPTHTRAYHYGSGLPGPNTANQSHPLSLVAKAHGAAAIEYRVGVGPGTPLRRNNNKTPSHATIPTDFPSTTTPYTASPPPITTIAPTSPLSPTPPFLPTPSIFPTTPTSALDTPSCPIASPQTSPTTTTTHNPSGTPTHPRPTPPTTTTNHTPPTVFTTGPKHDNTQGAGKFIHHTIPGLPSTTAATISTTQPPPTLNQHTSTPGPFQGHKIMFHTLQSSNKNLPTFWDKPRISTENAPAIFRLTHLGTPLQHPSQPYRPLGGTCGNSPSTYKKIKAETIVKTATRGMYNLVHRPAAGGQHKSQVTRAA